MLLVYDVLPGCKEVEEGASCAKELSFRLLAFVLMLQEVLLEDGVFFFFLSFLKSKCN